MKGFKTNIEKDSIENKNFRKVQFTGKGLQLVLMSLKAGEDIGEEIHKDADQFFRIEKGKGKCLVDGHEYRIHDGDIVLVPAGAKHNVINTDSKDDLKLYTLYSPPQHKDGVVRSTKEAAARNEEKFDGKTTEMVKAKPVH
jgi:mannose-6-phosphate isomerase-like protein (cupin superfamily)